MAIRFAALLAGAAALAPVSAFAAGAYTLTINGDANIPTLTLTNTSAAGIDLTSFSFTIGLTTKNFDQIYTIAGPVAPTLAFGSATQGGTSLDGGRTDAFTIAFADFQPGETASWDVDVDQDDSNTVEEYRTTFFTNGAGPNSVATVLFSDGSSDVFELPDGDNGTSFTFERDALASEVPLPAAAPLLLAGLGALAALRRKG